MATKEQAIMMQEVYQAIKNNGFKNRHELEDFLLKDEKNLKKPNSARKCNNKGQVYEN